MFSNSRDIKASIDYDGTCRTAILIVVLTVSNVTNVFEMIMQILYVNRWDRNSSPIIYKPAAAGIWAALSQLDPHAKKKAISVWYMN